MPHSLRGPMGDFFLNSCTGIDNLSPLFKTTLLSFLPTKQPSWKCPIPMDFCKFSEAFCHNKKGSATLTNWHEENSSFLLLMKSFDSLLYHPGCFVLCPTLSVARGAGKWEETGLKGNRSRVFILPIHPTP